MFRRRWLEWVTCALGSGSALERDCGNSCVCFGADCLTSFVETCCSYACGLHMPMQTSGDRALGSIVGKSGEEMR